jgi:hypothetical protein
MMDYSELSREELIAELARLRAKNEGLERDLSRALAKTAPLPPPMKRNSGELLRKSMK